MQYKFIDLFCGIGGIRIGFEAAGCKCVYSNDFDKFAQHTYFANFGEVPDGDITKVDAQSVPDCDIIVGGFPCQPFSTAGVMKRKEHNLPTGFADKTKGTLFFDVCRFIEAKRPRAFLLENVKGLLCHDHGNTFRIVLEELDSLGYDVHYQVVDGQNYVPQHRERVLVFGFDRQRYGNVDFQFVVHPKEPKPILADILESNPHNKYTLRDGSWFGYAQRRLPGKQHTGEGTCIASPLGITHTLKANYRSFPISILLEQPGKNPRKLTPRECARLMGFDDSFKIVVSDSQAYKQFGNSVVVPLFKDAAKQLVEKLENLDGRSEV